MGFFKELADKDKELKRKLIMAKITLTPEKYIKKQFSNSLILGLMLLLTSFFFFSGLEMSGTKVLLYSLGTGIITYFTLFYILKHQVDVKIRKLEKDIDREVLFAGRFLLVKLNSGTPLITALSQAAHSYGVASHYFEEIVRDIDVGTPLEQALDNARRYSPSKKFRRILSQIADALKIGVDVTQFLESILDEIAESQLIEIKKYGKKLNGMTMFYMLLSIILPSLGITLMITVISLINVKLNSSFFFLLAFFLLIIEFFFISIFRSIRPNVNI